MKALENLNKWEASPTIASFVWAIACISTVVQCFLQYSIGIIAIQLRQSLLLDAFQLSLLSASYYIVYVALQTPGGMLIDHFGPRKLLTYGALVSAIGCFLFGYSEQLLLSMFARILMGAGMSFAFIATLNLAANWFPLRLFPFLTGLSEAVAMGGVLFANMILASALLFFPWQQCFIYIAIFILVLSIVTGIFVRNTPDNAQRPIEHIDRSLLKDLKRTLKDPRFWLLGTYCGICYTVITVYAALWSNPFLVKAHRLTNYQSTVATALIYLGLAIGSPLLTWLFGHHPKRHAIMIIAPLVLCGLLSLLIYLQNLPMIILFSLNLLLGLCSGVLILSYTLTAEIAPSNAKSTCLGFLNTLALGTAPCFQPVIGFILEKQTDVIVNDIEFYTAENYQNALSILPIILALASVVILWFYRVHSNSAQIA